MHRRAKNLRCYVASGRDFAFGNTRAQIVCVVRRSLGTQMGVSRGGHIAHTRTHTHTLTPPIFLEKKTFIKMGCVRLKNGLSRLLSNVGQPSKCPVNYVIFLSR